MHTGILRVLSASAAVLLVPGLALAPWAAGAVTPLSSPTAYASKAKAEKDKDKSGDQQGPGGSSQAPDPAAPSTATPVAPTVPTPPAPSLALTPPQIGQSFGVGPSEGTVRVRITEDAAVQALGEAVSVPMGSHIDTRTGTVELTSAIDAQGTTQTATFSGSIFEVRQAPGGNGMTEIVLLGGSFRHCRVQAKSAMAHAAARRTPVRSLWGSDSNGRFVTKGRGSVATVRGTRWLTEDFCNGTRTTVAEGSVAVRDLATQKTVLVKAGHSYYAHRTIR